MQNTMCHASVGRLKSLSGQEDRKALAVCEPIVLMKATRRMSVTGRAENRRVNFSFRSSPRIFIWPLDSKPKPLS